MKKEYEINDLLMYSVQKINEVTQHVSTSNKKRVFIDGKNLPIWYILAMILRILLKITVHLKENNLNKTLIEIDFEEVNKSFINKDLKNKNNGNN